MGLLLKSFDLFGLFFLIICCYTIAMSDPSKWTNKWKWQAWCVNLVILDIQIV